ncbi:MAG TPA: response regulator transcription factor [Nocardioidaceae bacterium]|nr:response regulator transcription factor [Nocardioidaceae bacterium]
MIRIILADDQDLVRAGLSSLLAAYEDLDVVGQAADGAEAVALALRLRPDLVVMDLRMPRRDGIEATAELRRVAPQVRVLVLTTFDDDELVHAALRGGASGFLLKDAPVEQLVYAIRCIHSGEALVSPSITRRLLDRLVPAASRPLPALTERERSVLVQLARGLSNRELAAELHLSEATVKTHVSNLLTKLGLRDRLQAVVLAYESGLVRPGKPAD